MFPFSLIVGSGSTHSSSLMSWKPLQNLNCHSLVKLQATARSLWDWEALSSLSSGHLFPDLEVGDWRGNWKKSTVNKLCTHHVHFVWSFWRYMNKNSITLLEPSVENSRHAKTKLISGDVICVFKDNVHRGSQKCCTFSDIQVTKEACSSWNYIYEPFNILRLFFISYRALQNMFPWRCLK